MRSSPQVIGAAHDAVAYARTQVEIELNGVGDNPIFLTDERETLTGANFQGTPVALPMDMVGDGGHDGLRPVGAPAQPADEPGPERRACRRSSRRAPGCSPG